MGEGGASAVEASVTLPQERDTGVPTVEERRGKRDTGE